MANRYANLPGAAKIKDTYDRINQGFDLVEQDIDQIHQEIDRLESDLAQEIADREAAVEYVDQRVDNIIVGGGPDKDPELVDIRTVDPSYTPQRTINTAGDVTRDMQAQFMSHKAETVTMVANVRGFGATGEYVADDTAAFQAAHDYVLSLGGGEVYVPPGTYKVQGVRFDPRVYWRGAGAGVSIIKSPINAIDGLPIFEINPASTSVEFGGFKGLSIIGNGGSSFYQPDGNATVIGIDLKTSGDNWVQQFYIEDCFFAYLDIAVRLHDHVRYVPVTGNRFWYNNIGMWVENEHPNFGINDFRYNDIGLDGTLLDADFHGTKFNYNRIGINANVDRCGFHGCMFWQNKELGLTLGVQNRVLGCLFRGGDSFFNSSGGSLIKINGRQAVIQGNQFYGAHNGPGIVFASGGQQNGHIIDNNIVYIDDGHFIEKTGSGNIQSFKLTNNYIIVRSAGDGLGGMIVRVPSTVSGAWQHARYSGNDVRVESVDQDHYLFDIQKGGLGHITTGNFLIADNCSAKGFYFADNTDAIITENRFRTSNGGTWEDTINPAGFTSGLIVDNNIGFSL